MSDIVTAIEEDIEGVFQPKPGGIVDRHRQDKARREEAARERQNADERQEEHGYKSVKVTVLSPEVVATNTVVIPAGGTGMVLPNSPYRSKATIISSVPIILAKDASSALGGTNAQGAPQQLPTYSAVGNVVNPSGIATIAAITIAVAGVYSLAANVIISGAPTTADINNVILTGATAPAGYYIYLANGIGAGISYPFGPFENYYPAGTVVAIKVATGGSGAATYNGGISATPVTSVGYENGGGGGGGYPLAANTPFLYSSRAQLWAYSPSTAEVSTLSELYAPEI